MALPPLYKYLGVQGAKLTLGDRSFKHAKPSDFDDTEDLTIRSIFAEETEVALTRLSCEFTDVILRHLNDIPTCSSPMKEKVAVIQYVYRTNQNAADAVKAAMAEEGRSSVYDMESMRASAQAFVTKINEFMQGNRVLCVSTRSDSEELWSDYAENHKGIALRIEPNLAKDSKFQLFRPVIYREKRPPLYDNAVEFMAASLFGDQEARLKAIVEKIIYTKTLKWEHQSEYRLVIPLRQNEEPWNTLKYHPEEITELYLGLSTVSVDEDEIVGLALAVNPNIKVFRAKRNTNGNLGFDRARRS
jgi:hypothetical protein